MLEISNLSIKFGKVIALNNVSFKVAKGRVEGIIGENGAGKTTLFRCIAGLEQYKGNIESDNILLKNHLGFLPTEPYFFSKMTAKEYIVLMCNARNKIITNLDAKNIFDLPLNQYVNTYSAGMKKKLALWGVLLQDNDFLILDEPFNGVDIQSNIMITEIIHQLKSMQKTILISSHIFSTLSDVCDTIHLLSQGILVKTVNKENFADLQKEIEDVCIQTKINNLFTN